MSQTSATQDEQSTSTRCPSLVRRVLDVFDCHDPSPRQIKLAQELLFNISLKVEVLYQDFPESEEACLILALHNQTADQIADTLSISRRTVEEYLERSRKRLGCKTTPQAVIEGVRHGLLSVSERLKSLLFQKKQE